MQEIGEKNQPFVINDINVLLTIKQLVGGIDA